jgi:hypothetical protein
MCRSFGLVDTKVQEAEYFLDRILSGDRNFFGVRCDTVAFAAAARSITFAMQASLGGVTEFDTWYSARQNELRNNRLAKFFNDFRRVSQHIGENAVVGGSYANNKVVYYFGLIPEVKSVPTTDVATACSDYFRLLLQLVYDCYLKFNPVINGQWRYTRAYFDSIGQSIEDAEQSLGYPRGWTGCNCLDEDTRWRLLRREADGCNIQPQFERWLNKRVPHPDDERQSHFS